MNGLAKRLKTHADRTREIRERERLLEVLKKWKREGAVVVPRDMEAQ